MEKDFHYNLINCIAKMTELDYPDKVAYASQFVDDNNEGSFSIDGRETLFPIKIKATNGNYYPIMTQSLSPKSLDNYIQKYVYVPFHFMPGDNQIEIKGEKNPFNTTPNSHNAKTVLQKALTSKDKYWPYRLGIALHTYADTWSHQNFSGLQESWNSVYPWYNIFKSIAPNIGHAEAGHSPDVISETWTDHRLGRNISNQKRAFEATSEIYKALRRHTGKGPKWSDIKSDFKALINAVDYDERRAKINELLRDNHKKPVPDYDEDAWIDAALERKDNEIVMNHNFDKTDWFNFQEAAKNQFSLTLNLISGI